MLVEEGEEENDRHLHVTVRVSFLGHTATSSSNVQVTAENWETFK